MEYVARKVGGMARKTKEGAQATRESILDAAELCFLQQGVFRTTLEHIAARAGCTRGAVYWHFKNKLEVLDVVMDRIEQPLISGLEQLDLASHDQPIHALRAFYQHSFDEFARNPHARNTIEILMLRCELVRETQSILLRQKEAMTRTLNGAIDAFRRARQLGQLHEHLDPDTCAMAVHCLLHGIVKEWLLNPRMSALQREGMAVLDVVLDGFLRNGLRSLGPLDDGPDDVTGPADPA